MINIQIIYGGSRYMSGSFYQNVKQIIRFYNKVKNGSKMINSQIISGGSRYMSESFYQNVKQNIRFYKKVETGSKYRSIGRVIGSGCEYRSNVYSIFLMLLI